VLVLGALAVLVVEAVRPGRRRLLDGLTLGALVASALALRPSGTPVSEGGAGGTFCLPSGECSYVVSELTVTVQAVVVGGALVCLLLAAGDRPRPRAEHHLLLLSATAGAVVLAGARDLATLVVALETASLPVVGLLALRRTVAGAEAALKLLLTAVVSLGLLLLGVALLYAATGSVHLSGIAAGLPPAGTRMAGVGVLGAVLALAGLGFKLSAVPFHLWTPDTYAGAPVPVAAFLAVVSKAAAAVAVVLLLALGLAPLASVWAPVVAVLAGVTMTVGNLVALRQRAAVRLLAWSTVAQAGWVLLPLAGAGAGTPEVLRRAVAASLAYLVAYAAATLAAFAVVSVVARAAPDGRTHSLDTYRGLARRHPAAAAVLGLALAALAGLPPGILGLVGKVLALRPVVDAGGWALAVVAAVNVALGLAYYLGWAARLVAAPAPAAVAPDPPGPVPLTPVAPEPVGGEPTAAAPAAARRTPGMPGAALPAWHVGRPAAVALALTGGACVLLSLAPQLLAGLLPSALR
jgi:NADH-quinone oxidoreductase subunit N